MAAQIVIPKLGLTTDDATIVEWKAKEGDWIEKGTVVLVLETQKVEWNVEAEAPGFLHMILAEGDKAAIGTVVGLLAETREELEKLARETAPISASVQAVEAASPHVAGAPAARAEGRPCENNTRCPEDGRGEDA